MKKSVELLDQPQFCSGSTCVNPAACTPGICADAPGDVVILRLDPLRHRLAKMKRHDVLGRHAVVRIAKPLHFAHDQSGAAGQNERQRNLRDDQRVANTAIAASGGRAAALLRQNSRIDATRRQRRSDAEKQRRQLRTRGAETRTRSNRTRLRPHGESAGRRTRRAGCSSSARRRCRRDRRRARAADSQSGTAVQAGRATRQAPHSWRTPASGCR